MGKRARPLKNSEREKILNLMKRWSKPFTITSVYRHSGMSKVIGVSRASVANFVKTHCDKVGKYYKANTYLLKDEYKNVKPKLDMSWTKRKDCGYDS